MRPYVIGAILIVTTVAALLVWNSGPAPKPQHKRPAPPAPIPKPPERADVVSPQTPVDDPKPDAKTPTAQEADAAAREKKLEEGIATLRADFEARVAKIKGRSRFRQVLHPPGENGNAWDFYRQAYEKLGEGDIEQVSSLRLFAEQDAKKKIKTEDVLTILEKYKESLDLALKGTRQHWVNFDRDYLKLAADNNDRVLHLSLWRSDHIAASLSAQAMVLMKEGKPDEALDRYADGFRYAQDLAYGETAINLMISIGMSGTVWDGAVAGLKESGLTRDGLSRFAGDLEKLREDRPSLAVTLEAETVISQAYAIYLLEHSTSDEKAAAIFSEWTLLEFSTKVGRNDPERREKINNAAAEMLKNGFTRDVVLEGARNLATYFDRLIENEHKPYKDFMKESNNVYQESRLADNVFSQLFVTSPRDYSFISTRESRSKLDLLMCAVALKRYEMDHGRFPLRIEELAASGYMNTIPLDPFTSDPFKYKLSADGMTVTVYFVTSELEDHGGRNPSRSIILKLDKK